MKIKSPDHEDYELITWPNLESMCQAGCPCCNEKHSKENPLEFASKCHPGEPTWVQYWDGFIYIRCSVCEKPIGKIEVSRSLLPRVS